MTVTDVDLDLDQTPSHLVPCWVGVYYPEKCPDRLAEWLLFEADGRCSGPLCTGCKDRFRRLNPDWVRVERL